MQKNKNFIILKIIISLCLSSFILIFYVYDQLSMKYLLSYIIIIGLIFVSLVVEKRKYTFHALDLMSFLMIIIFIALILPSFFLIKEIQADYAIKATLALLIALMMIRLGGLIADVGLNKNISETRTGWIYEKGSMDYKPKVNTLSILIVLVTLITELYWIVKTPSVPLLEMITNFGSSTNLLQKREESFKLLELPSVMRYSFEWVRYILWPLMTCMQLAKYKMKGEKRDLFIFFIYFLIGLFITSSTTAKAVVAEFILSLMITYVIASNKKISGKVYFVGIILVFMFPFIVFLFTGISANVSNPLDFAIKSIWLRLFDVVPRAAMVHYMVFPDHVGFLYGKSISIFSYIKGSEVFPLNNFLFVAFNPYGSDPNPSGYLNAAYTSEMWANFGWLGIILSSLFIGWFLKLVDSWVKSHAKTPLSISIYSLMFLSTFALISTNITTALMTYGFILLCLILWIFGTRKIKTD